ncbi:hypothetical protein PGT21_025713 [Puccinia graminis f. sp. tritici]|uniref:Uncharacterized protein n=1 Tax=Puccinia graminis f. sp. tritici TaxID=56615 RepID=A0A5B0NNI5_PUCGR|nr:hypothetical protein PGT21_025713 [Puccinia graminis f. sp. tritici]
MGQDCPLLAIPILSKRPARSNPQRVPSSFVRKCFEICARRGGRPGPWSRYISQRDAKGIPKVLRRRSDSFSTSFQSTYETPVVSKSTPKGYFGMIPKAPSFRSQLRMVASE